MKRFKSHINGCLGVLLLCSVEAVFAQSKSNLKALDEYADMLALNEGCKTQNIDHANRIEQFLVSKIALMELVLKRQTFPKEVGVELRLVLDKTKRKDFDKAAFDLLKADTLKQSPKSIAEVCAAIPQAIDRGLANDEMAKAMLQPRKESQ